MRIMGRVKSTKPAPTARANSIFFLMPGKTIKGMTSSGAKVILVDGNYDAAFDLSIEASREFGWYCRNTGYNPFTAEGKKTAAFEIWETLLMNLESGLGNPG